MTDIDTIRIRFVEVTEADPASIDLPLPRLVFERRWYAAHVQTDHADAWVCVRVDEWGHDAEDPTTDRLLIEECLARFDSAPLTIVPWDDHDHALA